MAPIPSFTVAALAWQSFYILVGTAAATLIGLMFVAVTFGAGLITPQTSPTARSFLDPTVTHFAQILLTACLMTIPTMGPTVLGVLLVGLSALRTRALVRVFGHIRAAHRTNHDIELSDWLTGIALPVVCHALLFATGVGFVKGYIAAFDGLAIITIVMLLTGIFGAWELMVWMAVARARAK
jgi:hypothetical protein